MLTRAHPMKDHGNLIRAVARLLADGARVHLILAGRGVDDPGGRIARAVAAAGIGRHTSLLGEREDISPVTAGLDVLASSSAWGEAFPLIVGDAIGERRALRGHRRRRLRWIVDGTGAVVPPRDSKGGARAAGGDGAGGAAQARRGGPRTASRALLPR